MILSRKLLIPALFVSFSFFAQVQSPVNDKEQQVIKQRCGTVMPPAEWDTWFNSKVERYQSEKAQGKVQAVSLTIPVVVHVIHGGQSIGTYPNISQALCTCVSTRIFLSSLSISRLLSVVVSCKT